MRRTTKRTVPVYPRITKDNGAWLSTVTKKFGVSKACFIDELLTFSRKQGVLKNKKLFSAFAK